MADNEGRDYRPTDPDNGSEMYGQDRDISPDADLIEEGYIIDDTESGGLSAGTPGERPPGGRRSSGWAWLSAILLLIMIVIVCGVLVYMRYGGSASLFWRDPETGLIKPAVTAHSRTLGLRVLQVDSAAIAPFTCSTEQIDGYEYLVFTDGDVRICYRNEYRRDETDFANIMLIERGKQRYMRVCSYDLSGDLVKLCPVTAAISDKKMLVFTKKSTVEGRRIPESLTVFNCVDFRYYACADLYPRFTDLTHVRLNEDDTSIYSDRPVLIDLATSKATYKYAVTEEQYAAVVDRYGTEIEMVEVQPEEGLEQIPDEVMLKEAVRLYADLNTDFVYTIGTDGINWSTTVRFGDDLYLGTLSGSLGVGDGGVFISGAKFSAIVDIRLEDPERQMTIIPATEVPARYLSAYGYGDERYIVPYNDAIAVSEYPWSGFDTTDPNDWQFYDADGQLISHRGIDVSKYQTDIDWVKVAESGVEFAIIRVGFRGNREGTLEADSYFKQNAEKATAAGVKIGVYYYSQAITKAEAVEEAQYVLKKIKPYKITYPVIIDTERSSTVDARANKISMDTRTDVCIAFCETIKAAGYTPMIYCNTKYMLMGIDRTRLSDYDMWFAAYTPPITFPYSYQMLQYSSTGTIDGIKGAVDLDISFVDYGAGK